jgi:hypothetical protein
VIRSPRIVAGLILPCADLLAEAPQRGKFGQELLGHIDDLPIRVIQTALDLPFLQPCLLPVPSQLSGDRLELPSQLPRGCLNFSGHFLDRTVYERSSILPGPKAQGGCHVQHRDPDDQHGHHEQGLHKFLPG